MKRLFTAVLFSLYFFTLISVAEGVSVAVDVFKTTHSTEVTAGSSDVAANGIYSIDSNNSRIADLNQIIDKWASVPVLESAARFGVSTPEVEDRITMLTALQNFYRRLNVAIDKTAGFKAEVAKRESEKEQAKFSIEEKPPFSLSYYDNYLSKVEEFRAKRDTLKDSIYREQKAIVSSKSRLDDIGEALRLAQSEAQSAKEDKELLKKWELRSVKLREELWKVTLAYFNKNLENLLLQEKAADLRLGQTDEIRKYVYSNLIYDKKDLEKGNASYSIVETELKKKIVTLSEEVEKVEKAYADSHTRLSAATGRDAVDKREREFAEADLEREYLYLSLEQTQEMFGFINEMRDIWVDRYDLLSSPGVSTDVLLKNKDEVGERIGRFEGVLISQQKYQASLHSMRVAIDKESDEEKDKVILSSLKKRSKLLDRIMSQNMNYMVSVISLEIMNKRLLEELKGRLSSVNFADKVTSIWKTRTIEVLNTELWQAGGYAVRLKEFVIALMVLFFGLVASRKIATFIRKWLMAHSKRVDITGAHAIERFLYYVLIFASFLFSLKIVNVPLTAFAFLGGAVAIGVGFGAQNLFNNLISGFILMIQQPFKINDIVQFDDITATVIEIESRSTKVRTFDNLDVLVPNSYFLENKLINWTLSDKVIRGKLEIGVAYGTEGRKVEDILLQVVKNNPVVMIFPEPYVIFSDYGDSALKFVLYFWVDVRKAFPNKVASEMRYSLQTIFKEEGIAIPFPQMDVYLKKDESFISQ